MENFLSSLGFDVITTIVSAIIIFLCRNFIMITLSYIINLFSTDDVNINGVWYGRPIGDDYEDPNYEEKIIIHRVGKNVIGTVETINGIFKNRKYYFKGKFCNLTFVVWYKSKDNKNMEMGNYSLCFLNCGSEMEGYVTYYRDDKKEMKAAKYILKRKD